MIKINWKLDGADLIKDIIRLIRYYELRTKNVDHPKFCNNSLRRYKIERYILQLKKDLSLFWASYHFLKWHGSTKARGH